jgi:hypothetical protein
MLGYLGQELLVSILTTRNQYWKLVLKTYYCKTTTEKCYQKIVTG